MSNRARFVWNRFSQAWAPQPGCEIKTTYRLVESIPLYTESWTICTESTWYTEQQKTSQKKKAKIHSEARRAWYFCSCQCSCLFSYSFSCLFRASDCARRHRQCGGFTSAGIMPAPAGIDSVAVLQLQASCRVTCRRVESNNKSGKYMIRIPLKINAN